MKLSSSVLATAHAKSRLQQLQQARLPQFCVIGSNAGDLPSLVANAHLCVALWSATFCTCADARLRLQRRQGKHKPPNCGMLGYREDRAKHKRPDYDLEMCRVDA